MNTIRLSSCPPQDVTLVSNSFLDRFLPHANGEFLKIYLYLLRTAGSSSGDISLSGIADILNCTEADIQRAIRYWEKENVLILSYAEDGAITEISFPETSVPNRPQQSGRQAAQNTAAAETVTEKSSQVTSARMAELGENEDIRELFFVAQQYLGRPLTRPEMQKICFFYDNLHFSADLIDYLIDYCVSRGKTSFHYMEKVAVNWKEQGITTVHEARVNVGSYHREYYDILKALGINNHHPVEAEIKLMKKWLEKYSFSMDIIEEACARTLMGTGKPNLSYTDSILSKWHQNGVREKSDIERLDTEHHKQAAVTASGKTQKRKSSTAFSEFEQRDYDYSALESRLLKKKTP